MNYLDNQFQTYSPCTLEKLDSIKVKLHSERASTNWLNIDATAARAIEEAIEASYKRKAQADDPTGAFIRREHRNPTTGLTTLTLANAFGARDYFVVTDIDKGCFILTHDINSPRPIAVKQDMADIKQAAIAYHAQHCA